MRTARFNIATIFLLANLMASCGISKPRRHFVILIDVSKSIDPVAENDAFQSVNNLVEHFRRGDLISLIPIESEAQADVQGRIIRYAVPETREAYNQDLRRFAHNLHQSLERLKADALSHPGNETDILGSLDLAQEEFEMDKGGCEFVLIVLSDFIQEDHQVNFKTDRALDDELGIGQLVANQSKQHPILLAPKYAYLGSLRSPEFGSLPPARRQAIRLFWIQYFRSQGKPPDFVTDGPGLLGRFVESTTQ